MSLQGPPVMVPLKGYKSYIFVKSRSIAIAGQSFDGKT